MEIEVSDFMVVEVDKVTYLPLEALIVALYDNDIANRPFMEVMREYPHNEFSKPPPFDLPTEELLVPEIEGQGFSMMMCSTMSRFGQPKEHKQSVAEISWASHLKGLPHPVASIEFDLEPRIKASWYKPCPTDLKQLFTKELERQFPDPAKIFTPKGIAYLVKSRQEDKRFKSIIARRNAQ